MIKYKGNTKSIEMSEYTWYKLTKHDGSEILINFKYVDSDGNVYTYVSIFLKTESIYVRGCFASPSELDEIEEIVPMHNWDIIKYIKDLHK